MTYREQYRRMIYCMLAVSIAGLFFGCWLALKNQIPGQLYVTAAGQIPEVFGSPFDRFVSEEILERESDESPEQMSLSGESRIDEVFSDTGRTDHAAEQQTAEIEAGNIMTASVSHGILEHVGETYEVVYSLLGKIPLKTASVTVVSRKNVYAGGTPVGIYMETDGVMVVDTARVTGIDGEEYEPAANVLKAGDYIHAANGVDLETKEELIECFNQSDGKDVVLDIIRNGEGIQLKVTPVQTGDHDYKAGIWVRNDTQGIGTLTYVDESGQYGALGHGISDVDTGELLQIKKGILYNTDVISIVKGKQGSPGELAGVIHYSDGYIMGSIDKNQENGIYGVISASPQMTETMQSYEVAYKQEVETGPATILSTVDGTCREYQIEIQEVRLNGKDINKGMVLKVTDPGLLEMTGGIVQGMSGSPIIQNGRIVGAVTHVFVNDPTKGYGIFIENMLEH